MPYINRNILLVNLPNSIIGKCKRSWFNKFRYCIALTHIYSNPDRTIHALAFPNITDSHLVNLKKFLYESLSLYEIMHCVIYPMTFLLDINECAIPESAAKCSHNCHNVNTLHPSGDGYYRCSCRYGYTLMADGRSCAGKQSLIISSSIDAK